MTKVKYSMLWPQRWSRISPPIVCHVCQLFLRIEVQLKFPQCPSNAAMLTILKDRGGSPHAMWQPRRLYSNVLTVFFHSPSCQIAPQICKKKRLINSLPFYKKHQKYISDAALREFTDLRIVVKVCCICLCYCSLQI